MVIIYTTPNCHFCKEAKDYLTKLGVSWIARDVTRSPQDAQEMIKKSGQMGVPVLDIDGKIILGFNKLKIDQCLKKTTA
jgi:glutaredoxin-like YruB-family protein